MDILVRWLKPAQAQKFIHNFRSNLIKETTFHMFTFTLAFDLWRRYDHIVIRNIVLLDET